MRLGAPVFGEVGSADQWVAALKAKGYSATFFPIDMSAGEATVKEYVRAAESAGIVIAEVGAWSNPISPNEDTRRTALAQCIRQLALAELVGARCCVNIAGSRHPEQWDAPHADNFSEATFDLIVETVRSILDAVKPTRTYYSLETMPWAPPDSADSYVSLIRAIDRGRFAVHLDPVNLVCSPQRYYATGALLRECFEKLGPHIRSCHAKDIVLRTTLTTHLDEVRPGLGGLDYGTFVREAEKLGPDTVLMLEHLPNEEEYDQAAQYIRSVAAREGVAIR